MDNIITNNNNKFINTINVNMCFGLASIIQYFIIFLNNPQTLYKIMFSKKLINQYRNNYDDTYYTNQIKIIKHIISYNNMTNVIFEDNNEDYKIPFDIVQFPIKVKYIIYKDLVKSLSDIQYNNYILINTKVLCGNNGNIEKGWNNFKSELFNLFNSSNINIMVTGEKKISKCHEYDIHKTISIYDDIINNIKSDKLIDLTSNDTISLYDIDKVLYNIELMKKSKFNIMIGDGGAYILHSIFNNTITFGNNNNNFNNFMSLFLNNNNNFITNDTKLFINTIHKNIIN